MEDGLTLTYSYLKMVIWFQKNVLLTNKKQKVIIVVIINNANQLQKLRNLTSLEEVGETLLKKKMMKEIMRNGPINGDFQAPKMFSIYKEGIFSEKGLIDIH